MAKTISKRMLFAGAPFAWLHEIEAGTPAAGEDPAVPGTITELYRFDDLQDSQIDLLVATADSSGDHIEAKRADGAVWRFPKDVLYLDGITEEDITPIGQTAGATKNCKVQFNTLEAPLPTSITSLTLWLKDIISKKSSIFLLTIPTGFTYDSKINQGKCDGYMYVAVKQTGDLSLKQSENPAPIGLTFESFKVNLAEVTGTVIEGVTYTAIAWKGKSVSMTPPDLTTGDGAIILAGDVVLKQDATYSYA